MSWKPRGTRHQALSKMPWPQGSAPAMVGAGRSGGDAPAALNRNPRGGNLHVHPMEKEKGMVTDLRETLTQPSQYLKKTSKNRRTHGNVVVTQVITEEKWCTITAHVVSSAKEKQVLERLKTASHPLVTSMATEMQAPLGDPCGSPPRPSSNIFLLKSFLFLFFV